MGLISNTLLVTLQEQLDSHRTVVWFDPERAYPAVVDALAGQLETSKTAFARYDPDQGFLALRRALEPLWSQKEQPRLLIYAPISRLESRNALAEFILTGVCLEPDAQPPERNTRLSAIARRSLEQVLPAATVEKIVADIKNGQLNLAEIESLAEKGQEVQMGVLAIIFKTGNAEEIALRFLADPAVDKDLAAKAAGPALADLLGGALDVALTAGDDLASLRAVLGRHLLVTEFLTGLDGEIPTALQTIPLPRSKTARQAAAQIAQTWRLRRDLTESYVQTSDKVQAEMGLGKLPWTIETLHASETFSRTEEVLQTLIEKSLAEKPSKDLLDLASQRLSGFWAGQQPEIKLRWQLIVNAGQVILLAEKINQALKNDPPAATLFKKYVGENVGDKNAWCRLDTVQRKLERDIHNFDWDSQALDSLHKLVAVARQGYAKAVHHLAGRFVRAYEAASFNLAGVTQQADIYHDFVEPAASDGPVAYILVDAFRFEMACELCAQLPENWKVALTPAIATPPTITEVGMAALMPGAEKGLTLVPAGSSKLGMVVLGSILRNRPERMKHLEKKVHAPVVVTELNQVAPLNDKTLSGNLKSAQLVVITATDEIDGMWEKNPAIARQLQGYIFDQLRRGIRTLFTLGIDKVVITADHGFLAGDSLMVGEALDAPGGDTTDLHRRVWVGKGGAIVPASLRKPLSAFGIGGDLEVVTPYGMSTFKVPGGSTEYFHGGLSLQELVIPVISVSAGKSKTTVDAPAFRWTITPGSAQISTRFFSVTVKGEASELFSLVAPPRLRVEVRAGSQIISMPIAASYGFNEATHDVTMKFEADGKLAVNTITLQITDIPPSDSVSLYLLDEYGASLCPEMKLPINVVF